MQSEFRKAVGRQILVAKQSGQSYDDILADLATVIGCMIAAGSPLRPFRIARVKATMSVIAAVMDSPSRTVGEG